MASSSSSSSGVPPGFRFHPTDEELLLYYLRKKVSFERFDLEVIKEVDLNKLEPWDLQERCRIGSAPQNEWYFFSHKDRKYPTGSRTNRATNAGFWKATGRDKCIRNSYKKIGMRKTLVFYRGRAPHGQKTDWIMHEYRLEEGDPEAQGAAAANEDGWVVCRVFKKKHFFKIGGGSMGGEASNASQGMESHMPFIGIDPSRTHYLHQDQQHYIDRSSNLYGSDLALHYMPPQHYSPQVQVQNLLPDHRAPLPPPSYDFSVLPGEPSTMARQYQVCEPGMDVGGGSSSSCEPMPHVVAGRDPNDWTMLVATSRLGQDTPQMTTDAAMNQMSNPRGEMDLWGYGK